MSEKESGIDSGYNLDYQEDIDLLVLDSALLLLSAGHVEKAYGLSRLIKGGYEKTDLSILIADFLKSTNITRALALLEEASDVSLTAAGPWQRSELLCKIARKTAELGNLSVARSYLERAVEIARLGEKSESSQDQIDCSSVLGEIAEVYSSLGDQDEALRIASSISNEGKRSSVLKRLASK